MDQHLKNELIKLAVTLVSLVLLFWRFHKDLKIAEAEKALLKAQLASQPVISDSAALAPTSGQAVPAILLATAQSLIPWSLFVAIVTIVWLVIQLALAHYLPVGCSCS